MNRQCEMRVLLQQIASGEFLDEHGHWTHDRSEARDFHHFLDAFVYARDWMAGPIGAYCEFSDPAYDFSVSLRTWSQADGAKLAEVEQYCTSARGGRLIEQPTTV